MPAPKSSPPPPPAKADAAASEPAPAAASMSEGTEVATETPETGMVCTWYVAQCPWHEQCSVKAWARVYCKSQRSEAHCRRILWSHLSVSSLHENETKEDIYQCASEWPVEMVMLKKWTRPETRFLDSEELPLPTQEWDERQAIVAGRQLGEEIGHKPKQRKNNDTGTPSEAIAQMVQRAVEAAFSANRFALTTARGHRQGMLPSSAAEALKGALAATVRAGQAIDHTRHWLKKAEEVFAQEVKGLHDARKALESACQETGVHQPTTFQRPPHTPSMSPRRRSRSPALRGFRRLDNSSKHRGAIQHTRTAKEEVQHREEELRSQLQRTFRPTPPATPPPGREEHRSHRGSR